MMLISDFIQKLREENNFEEVKNRFKNSLIIQFYLTLSVPYFLAFALNYQNNPLLKFLGENYGLVTILAIPIYLRYLSFRKDGVKRKFTIGYFLVGFTIMMNYMISSIISNGFASLDFQLILAEHLSTTFSNPKIYRLFVDSILAPIIVLYSLYSYRFFISMDGVWDSTLFRKNNDL